jgi:RNA polymerase sigma factor (sigma-70 family)
MGPSSLASFIGQLRRLVEPRAGGLDDAELLQRFAANRDEAAFEVLLWRYGPLVLGVCRRMLHREQDVEDAFQATFLTLIRKAGSIARREALGSWLHQVAYRIGLRARTHAERCGIPDQPRVEIAVARTEREANGEWREVLDREVQRLPRRYRGPFILCYLEGKTQAEAARMLACPPGTVASRLAWARDRLRVRLMARGLTLTAALAGLIVPAETEAASLTVLIGTALRMARISTAGTLAGPGAIPGHVADWSKGVVRAMFLSKVQIMATLILAALFAGAGGGVLWQRVQANSADTALTDEPAPQAAAQSQQKSKVSRPVDPKATAAKAAEELQNELANAEAEFQQLEAKWDASIADFRRHLWEEERQNRQKKVRLTFEAKRISRELQMAENRYEKLTVAMDGPINPPVGLDTLQKKQREAQKQAEQLSAKLLQYEMELAEMDEPVSNAKLRIESLERQRAQDLGRARKRIEALERKLHPAAGDSTAERLRELERKVDALTQVLEDVRKALRR